MVAYVNPPSTDQTLQPYEQARADLLEWSDSPKLHSLVELGTVSSPGVSDLDIMLVYEDSAELEHIADLRNPPKSCLRYLENGSVIVATKQLYDSIYYIDLVNPVPLKGFTPLSPLPNSEDLKDILLASCIDWLPERTARLFAVSELSEINISHVLCLLKSCMYSLTNCSTLLDLPVKEYEILSSKISLLRNDWHSLTSQTSLLREAIQDTLFACCSMLDLLSEFSSPVLHKAYPFPVDISPSVFLHHSASLEFDTGQFPTKSCLSTFTQSSRVIIPSVLVKHFALLSSLHNPLSQLIATRFAIYSSCADNFQTNYSACLSRKVSLLSSNYEFLHRLDLRTGLLRYGFYVN